MDGLASWLAPVRRDAQRVDEADGMDAGAVSKRREAERVLVHVDRFTQGDARERLPTTREEGERETAALEHEAGVSGAGEVGEVLRARFCRVVGDAGRAQAQLDRADAVELERRDSVVVVPGEAVNARREGRERRRPRETNGGEQEILL